MKWRPSIPPPHPPEDVGDEGPRRVSRPGPEVTYDPRLQNLRYCILRDTTNEQVRKWTPPQCRSGGDVPDTTPSEGLPSTQIWLGRHTTGRTLVLRGPDPIPLTPRYMVPVSSTATSLD